MKQKKRKDPERGDVMAVPLSGDRWAYLFSADIVKGWIFRIASRGLVRDVSLFSRDKWLCPFMTWSGWSADCLTIGNIGFNWEVDAPMFYHDFGEDREPERRYRWHHWNDWRYVTEEATKGLHRIISTGDQKELRAYLKTLLPQMEWVEGEHSTEPQEVPPEDIEPETVDLLINDLPQEQMENVQDAARTALEKLGLTAEHIDDSESVIFRVPVEQAKETLTFLRRLVREIIDKKYHANIEFERLGPADMQRKVFGLNGKVIPDT